MQINRIKENIINKKDINKDIIDYANYIKNNSLIEVQEIIEEINTLISERLKELLYEDDMESFKNIPYLFDVIKNKTNSIDSSNSSLYLEKKILKMTKKKLEKSYKLHKIKNVTVSFENESYYKLINYFLTSESNYLDLKNMISLYPNMVNARFLGKHIVINIIDLYTQNYLKSLRKEDSLNTNYIREIYMLFTENRYLSISKKEKQEIDNKIFIFENEIRKIVKKSKKLKMILNETNLMKSKFYYLEKSSLNKISKVDEINLEKQINCLKNCYLKQLDDKSRIELNDEVISLSPTSAYSLQEGNTIRLKLHLFDYINLITIGSSIDTLLYNCLLEGIEVDKNITDILAFKKNNKYPTITYDMEIQKNGQISDLKIYTSIVTIKDIVGVLEFIDPNYLKIQRRLSNQKGYNEKTKSVKELRIFFESVFSREIAKKMFLEKIPYIYFGSKYELSKKTDELNNQIIDCLNCLSKSELISIKKLIEDKTDELHYTSHYLGEEATYNMFISSKLSYINVEHNRIIYDLLLNKNNLNKIELSNRKREVKKRNKKLIDELNKGLKYVEEETNEYKVKIKVNTVDKNFKSSKIKV